MTPTRFIHVIGKRKLLGKYWKGQCSGYSAHYTKTIVIENGNNISFGSNDKERINEVENVCKRCGCTPSAESEIKIHLCIEPVYNTESGNPEAGDLFWNDWLPENFYWDNHKGYHLMCVLPNGHEWNIDSRASNCTMPEDKNHKCWIRHGNPETEKVTVNKNGVTCNAGAGSIWIDDYHGFLTDGNLT